MTLTVGIATTGEDPRLLRETVEGVLRSATLVSDEAEVLVVVNGRGRVPELHGLASPALRVRYLDQRNVSAARNVVLAEARHDTILFTDDDCAVPPEWCAQLAAALREPGCAAVGAPVRLAVAGPVSAYADYQRMYDAVPAWPDGLLLLVTANCGLRRDLIPASIRFDPYLNRAGAEDTSLSLALGKAGLPIRWLAGATPIWHAFSEEIEEITERYLRNARNSVHTFLGHGHPESALPGVLDQYRQRISDDFQYDRRYGEFVAAEARTAFAVYDSLAAAAMAIGYLDQLGTEFDHPLLELDLTGLASAWREIGERVRARIAHLSPSDWATLQVDYAGMGDRLGAAEPLLAEVRQALRRYARPVPADPGGPLGDILNCGLAGLTVSYLESLEEIRGVFDELLAGAGPPPTQDSLDRAFRAMNVPLKMATGAVELTLRCDFRRMVKAARPGDAP